ncbi:MAG: hypothetical protein ACK4IK_07895 [Bacteroidia bacterium]
MRLLYLIFLFFLFHPIFAQDNEIGSNSVLISDTIIIKENPVTAELKFVNYLIANAQYNDALFALEKLQEDNVNISPIQFDSIHYYTGWINYFNKRFGKAISSFEKVSNKTDLYYNAKYYTSFCYAYTNNFDAAWDVLINLDISQRNELKDFHNFQLACLALLKRDLISFEKYSSSFKFSNYNYAKEEEQLLSYYNDIKSEKKKSGFLAALISAVIPGMGKFYAGYTGLPFGALFTTLPLAIVATESFIKAGLLSPQFIILGSLFGVFYIGNIWGSALSVNAIKKEKYAEINYNILFDMHIPLRRIFE